jgi:CRP/FNR family transcriptional regulator, cyclic AMP receptor protein
VDPANLRAIPLFAAMDEAHLHRIAVFAREDSVPAGARLMREGDYGDEVVAIESGTAEVTRAGAVIGTAGPGDVLGEIGVLEKEPRTATVTATTPMRLVRLSLWDVKRLPRDVRDRMAALAAERHGRDAAPPPPAAT